jgi:hypothetical protein
LGLKAEMLENDSEKMPQKENFAKKNAEEIKSQLLNNGEQNKVGENVLRIKPRDLEGVRKEIKKISEDFIRDGDRPIDKAIKDALIGLRRWNIDTKESCGGHRLIHSTQGSYPFVRFGKESKQIMETILELCPEGDEWSIALAKAQPDGSFMLYPKSQDYPPRSTADYLKALLFLESYQKSIKKSGEWLQNLPDDYDFAESREDGN